MTTLVNSRGFYDPYLYVNCNFIHWTFKYPEQKPDFDQNVFPSFYRLSVNGD